MVNQQNDGAADFREAERPNKPNLVRLGLLGLSAVRVKKTGALEIKKIRFLH